MEISPILALENDDNNVLLAVFCFYKKAKLSCEPKKGPRAGLGSEATLSIYKLERVFIHFVSKCLSREANSRTNSLTN